MKKLSILCILLLASTFFVTSAFAIGTPAGKVISNQAFVDYQDANGNAMTRAYSNKVDVTVSQVASVSLQPSTITQIGANGTQVVFLVQVFNNGNAPDTFNFTYNQASGWTPDQVKFYFDANHNHVFDPGIDTPMTPTVGTTYKTGVVAPDDDYDVLMVVTVPMAVADASTTVLTLTATSLFNQSVTANGTYTTKVSTAVLSAVTTHTPATPKPGDLVTFTTIVKNTGSATGQGVVLGNIIPANMTYTPGSIRLDSTIETDAKDTDAANYNVDRANGITVNLGDLASAGQRTIVFQATVNPNVPYNTLLSEYATVTYTIGAANISIQSTLDTDNVGMLVSIAMTPATQTASGNPGDQKIYQITLTNVGNATDTVTLLPTSGAGWKWDIWVDADNNGIPGTGADVKLTQGSQGATIQVPANSVINLLAIATVPVGTPDRTIDTTTMGGKSGLDATKTASVSFATTVTAPVFSLTKTVSPTGSQPPGTTLLYTATLTNSGSGKAKSVVLTDPIPQYTTYTANSIKTGPNAGTLVSKTDAPDGDGAMYDSAANAVVVGGPTNELPTGSSVVLQFSVVIN